MDINNFTIPIYRINTILSLFQNMDASYSIKELAELMNVPINVIREDLYTICNNKDYDTIIYPPDMEGDEDSDNDYSNFSEELKKGLHDDVPLVAETSFHSDVFLSITPLELNCLNDFLDEAVVSKDHSVHNYVTKAMYNKSNSKMQVKGQEIQRIIDNGQTIRVIYKPFKGDLISSVIRPLKLVHNAMDDYYYVVTITNGNLLALRLDRIKHYSVTTDSVSIPDLSPLDILPKVWGMELGTSEHPASPVHVKIRFLNEGNVVRKATRDLTSRTCGTITILPEDGSLIYEDDVVGMGSFKSFLYGYGSSAIVLEPEALRNEIIESARTRLTYYHEQ